MRRLENLLVAVTIAVCLAACSTSSGSTPRLEGMRAKAHFSTLRDLAAAASAVVVATAGTQSFATVSGAPTTTTNMELTRSLRGQVPQAFRLFELGRPGSGPDFPIVATGQSYLLFVMPYELVPGTPVADDLFVVVGGGAGLYATSGSTYTRVDKASPDLPETASASDVQAALQP